MAVEPVYQPNPISTEISTTQSILPMAELPTMPGDPRYPDLAKTHSLYSRNLSEWTLLLAAYEGVRELYNVGAIHQHERESSENYDRRLHDLYGFNYTQSVIDLFNYYLFKKPVKRDVKTLADHELWKLFSEDCDLQGTALDEFLVEAMRYASICGHVGVVCDNSQTVFNNKTEQVTAKSYPYWAIYLPTDILDWTVGKDATGRRELKYLKLHEEDDTYRLWYPDHWERWKKSGQSSVTVGAAQKIEENANPLGEIPFVWLFNLRPRTWPIGKSDVHDIARIDRSIVNNLSEGEEIIYFAAFPMMLAPMQEKGMEQTDEVGPTAVIEFDPERPDSKPSWLTAPVSEPLSAIMAWILRKVTEIYRASNAGGMAAMEVSTAPKSGAALQAEFQMLNAKLCQKAVNLERAEKQLIRLWLKWMGLEDTYFKDVSIERSRSYDVSNLMEDLENSLTSLAIVHSQKFKYAIEKAVARTMLPAAAPQEMAEIDSEIEAYKEYEALPRGSVEFQFQEDQDLDREKKELEVEQLEADIGKTDAEAKAAAKPKPPPTIVQAARGVKPPPFAEEEEDEE